MMTTLAVVDDNLEAFASNLVGLVAEALARSETAQQAKDVQARVEAAKAWAKVHGQAKVMRAQLLTAEVLSLIRVVQLGGQDLLEKDEVDAGEWFAALSEAQLQEALDKATGQITTAAGLWRRITADWAAYKRGRELADHPEYLGLPETLRAQRDEWVIQDTKLAFHNLKQLIEDRTTVGEPFTVDELAIDLLAVAKPNGHENDLVQQGVRDVCRTALNRARTLYFGDEKVPRFITVMDDGYTYVRVPTENATVDHLEQSLNMRIRQLEQDQAALDRFASFVAAVKSCPGADEPDARVGQFLESESGEKKQ